MDQIFSNQLFVFIAGLALLIFVHELGHFIAAKLLNVGVDEFRIGFQPRLVTLFEAGGTKFSLNWIPLGGFVRLSGENDPEIEGGFAAAKPWRRLLILFAGPFTNIMVGLVLGVIFVYSVGEIIPDKVVINQVIVGEAADVAGFQAGDRFIEINGVPINSTQEAIEAIRQYPGTPIQVTIERNGEEMTLEVIPKSVEIADENGNPILVGQIGIYIGNDHRPVSLVTAVKGGADEFNRIIYFVATFPVQLINGQISAEEGRFVGYRGMYEIFRSTPSPIWFFMMISIMLGIFNLLPIPALDGGRILLILPEIFLRKRIPANYETIIHMVGFILLILFMIYVNIQDWINPIQIPR